MPLHVSFEKNELRGIYLSIMQIHVYMEKGDLRIGISSSRQRLSAIQNAAFRLESWELTTFPFPLSSSGYVLLVI